MSQYPSAETSLRNYPLAVALSNWQAFWWASVGRLTGGRGSPAERRRKILAGPNLLTYAFAEA
jgi:hypothetical protein